MSGRVKDLLLDRRFVISPLITVNPWIDSQIRTRIGAKAHGAGKPQKS
jgi:hypothetical protein